MALFDRRGYDVGGTAATHLVSPIRAFAGLEEVHDCRSAEITRFALGESEHDPLARFIPGPPDVARVGRVDCAGLRDLLPVGAAGPWWFVRNFVLRFPWAGVLPDALALDRKRVASRRRARAQAACNRGDMRRRRFVEKPLDRLPGGPALVRRAGAVTGRSGPDSPLRRRPVSGRDRGMSLIAAAHRRHGARGAVMSRPTYLRPVARTG